VTLNPGQSIRTTSIPNAGARRYRVKVFSTLDSVDVHARDIRFVDDGTIWEDVFLGSTVAVAGGFRMVANFGEGTGVGLMMGQAIQIRCIYVNAGSARVVRFEFWTGY